jgi:aminoglycoside phosphotransferase (APT) family kinase protein
MGRAKRSNPLRIEALGRNMDARRLPASGVAHLDLHTDNVLIHKDALTGIIDWEGACAGDPRFDLGQLAFDLDGHD